MGAYVLSNITHRRYCVQNDAFIRESRVYDSLIEYSLDVGPKCHGWLTICTEQEHALDNRFNLTRGYTSTDSGLIQKLKHADLRLWYGFRQTPERPLDPVRGLLLDYMDGTTIGKATLTPQGASSLRNQLDDLHSLSIAHGDFYPRNIMVSKDGRPFVIDFSSAMIWPSKSFGTKEDFKKYMEGEKGTLEHYLFQLQQLQRHKNMKLTEAQSGTEAYRRDTSFISWTKEDFVD